MNAYQSVPCASAIFVRMKRTLQVYFIGIIALVAAMLVPVGSASDSVSAQAVSYFSPQIQIGIPQTDLDEDGVNDFSGITFDILFIENSGYASVCSWESINYVIRADGKVEPEDNNFRLLNSPENMDITCLYSARINNGKLLRNIRAFLLPGKTEGIMLAETSNNDVSAASPTKSFDFVPFFEPGYFSPDFTISAPYIDTDDDGISDLSGKNIRFVYRGYTIPCVELQHDDLVETYTVGNRGTVTLSSSAARLLNRAYDTGLPCRYATLYSIPFAERKVEALDIELYRTDDATYWTTEANRSAKFSFGSKFLPNISITVPQIDDDNDGINDFSGRTISVDFSRSAGAPSDCSKIPTTLSYTAEVGDDGRLTRTAGIPDLYLVERIASRTLSCSYDVTYSEWPDILELGSGATTQVSAASRSVVARYIVPGAGATSDDGAIDDEMTATEPEAESSRPEDSGEQGNAQAENQVSEQVESQPSQQPKPQQNTQTGSQPSPQSGAQQDTEANSQSAGQQSALPGTQESIQSDSQSGDGSATTTVPSAPEPEVGVVQLSQGWVMLPYNGESNMSPADFVTALESAIDSVWVWDLAAQQWKGWTVNDGALGLTSLVPGDVVMVYVPTDSVVVYSPADMLGHRAGVTSWTLAPSGISLVVYGGGTATSASNVFSSYADSAVVVYLWDSQNQGWEYYLPGRQPLPSVSVPWFTNINPGDAMFVYNISPTVLTIPWY